MVQRWTAEGSRNVPSGSTSHLVSVWASGPDDVWVAGNTHGGKLGVLRRWDGVEWVEVPTGIAWSQGATVTSNALSHVWGTGPDDVWVVGRNTGPGGVILHWDGTTMKEGDSGGASSLYRIWGSGPADVWSIGSLPGPDGKRCGIRHWNGTRGRGSPARGS